MTTSNSNDFNLVTNQIVEEAFREIGVKTPNRNLTSEEMNDGRRSLNIFVKSLIAQGSFLWKTQQATLFTSPSQAKYNIDGITANATEEFIETTSTSLTTAGSSLIDVASLTGFVKNYFIGLFQSNNDICWSTINRLGLDTIYTEDFNDVAGLTYDPTKIKVSGGIAQLDFNELPSQTFNQPFDSSTGFIFDPGKTEFTAGKAQQKDESPTDSVLGCTYTSITNANWNNAGVTTGVLNGSPVIVSEKLVCTGTQGVYYDVDSDGTAAVKFKYTPNYTTSPPANINVITFQESAGNNNRIVLTHSPSGNTLRMTLNDNAGGVVIAVATSIGAAWTPAAGTEYELELNWDSGAGVVRIFIDGILHGTLSPGAWTHGVGAVRLYVGAAPIIYDRSEASYADVVTFSTVQHTTNYTAGYTLPETKYLEDLITMPTFTYGGVGNIQSFDIFATTQTGAQQYNVNGQYWDGAAWAASDDTLSQMNSVADVNTNIGTLAANDSVDIKIRWTPSNNQEDIEDLTVTYTGETSPYPIDNPALDIDTAIVGDIKGWNSFIASVVTVGLDSITVALSDDNGSTYKYWNGSWSVSDGTFSQSASINDTNANISTFPITSAGMKIRLFLHSDDGTTTPTIDNLDVNYGVGDAVYINDTIKVDSSSGSAVYVYESKLKRPERIQNAQSRVNTNQDIPLTLLSRDTYDNLTTKNSEGLPNQLLYDKQLTFGSIFLWPVPNTSAIQVKFTFIKQIFDFDSATDDPDFPVEWLQPVILNVAYRLSRKYGRLNIQEKEQLKRDADESMADSSGYDREDTSFYFQPATSSNQSNYR